MVRTIFLTTSTHLSQEEVWKYIINVTNYPEFVPFVKAVQLSEPFAEGSVWHDVTTILGVPLRIKHVNERISHLKKVIFLIDLPFGGSMKQSYTLSQQDKKLQVTCCITFEVRPSVIEPLVTPLLEKRLKYMITTALEKIQ